MEKAQRVAVIFDMDGVIADTQHIHARVEAEELAKYGCFIAPAEISRRFSGVSGKDMFAQLFAEIGRPSPYCTEVSDQMFKKFCSYAHEFTGIEGTIAQINALHSLAPLAVASATRPKGIVLILGTIGVLDKFTAVASSKEVAHGKPAPDVFLLAAQKLGVDPADCIVIEDGVSGMIGAKAAGMRCVALARDGSTDFPADLVVKDLRDVPIEWFLNR